MEHVRCAHCRNPIRAHQATVRHPRADLSFHVDCWTSALGTVQKEYERTISDEGVEGLIRPYVHRAVDVWLPIQADLVEQSETPSVTAQPVAS